MKHLSISKNLGIKVLFLSLLIILWLALAPQPAMAQDGFDPVDGSCIGAYVNPVNCTAQDVRIEEIIDVVFEKSCDGVPDEGGYDMLTATFTLLVSAEPTPPRYDIGIFMAKYGNSATDTGSCYQDYLGTTLTTSPVYGDWNEDTVPDIYEGGTTYTGWWNGDGDACGDMERGTQVFMTDVRLTIACHDTDSADDPDTNADISMCVAWDEQAKNDCTGYTQAIPATPAKCSCETINFPFTPTALTQMSLEAENNNATTNMLVIAVSLLLVAGAMASFVLYRKNRAA